MENKKQTSTQFLQKTIVVWLGAMICCALWGSAFPCIKIGYRLFEINAGDTSTQILFAGCRFFLAGVLTILIGSFLNRKFLIPAKENLGKVWKLSMLQTVIQYFFFYVGLAHTTGMKASIITGLNVFMTILIASLLFHQEKLTMQKMIGCIVGFAGVVLVNLGGKGIDMGFVWNGEGFICMSALSSAFSSVCIKRYSQKENPVTLSGYQFLCGGCILMLMGLLMGGRIRHFTPVSVGILIYLAFISAVAYSLWGILLKYNPVSKVSVFGFMNPVFGVILSAILLKEEAQGVTSIIALVLVSTGIYIVNKTKGESE